PPSLLLVDLAPADDVRDDSEADRRRAEKAAPDRAPAIEARPRLEDAFRELVRAHAARLEDGVAVAVIGVEPPRRREETLFRQQAIVERGAGHRRQRIEVRDLEI